jgi:hypothetical protein
MATTTNIPGKKVSQGGYSAFVPTLDFMPRLIRVLSDADRLIGKLAGEGGRFLNGTERWCLWLIDASPALIRRSALVHPSRGTPVGVGGQSKCRRHYPF